MWSPPNTEFSVAPLTTGWGSLWATQKEQASTVVPLEDWQSDEALKRQYGIELAKNPHAFNAASVLFPNNVSNALWASVNWVNDSIVIASRQTVNVSVNLLDKDGLAVKLLKMADETFPSGGYVHELKDRIKALELYAKVQGFVDKFDVNNSTNIIDNRMEIILVEATHKHEEKLIENLNNAEIEDKPVLHDLELVVV